MSIFAITAVNFVLPRKELFIKYEKPYRNKHMYKGVLYYRLYVKPHF